MSNIFIIRNFNSKTLQNKNSKEYIERKIYFQLLSLKDILKEEL